MLYESRINVSSVMNLRECTSIVTFMICKKLKFDYTHINLKDIYGDIPKMYWHNVVLSIDDGMLYYEVEFADLSPLLFQSLKNVGADIEAGTLKYPYSLLMVNKDFYYECTPKFRLSDKLKKYEHFHLFFTC